MENIYKPTTRKDDEKPSTLAHMCSQMGIIMESNERLSKHVYKPCGRKIRNAHEYFTFIRSHLDSPATQTPKSPERFKRQLPTTVTEPERSPQPVMKSSTASIYAAKSRKALHYDEFINKTSDDDGIMSALNIDELYNTEKKTSQLKNNQRLPQWQQRYKTKF